MSPQGRLARLLPLVGSSLLGRCWGPAWALGTRGWAREGGAGQGQVRPGGPSRAVAGRLSVEWDYGGSMVFWQQASDLIPEQPCAGVSVRPPCPPASPGCPPPALWGQSLTV